MLIWLMGAWMEGFVSWMEVLRGKRTDCRGLQGRMEEMALWEWAYLTYWSHAWYGMADGI